VGKTVIAAGKKGSLLKCCRSWLKLLAGTRGIQVEVAEGAGGGSVCVLNIKPEQGRQY
jgi:hypothetical protein